MKQYKTYLFDFDGTCFDTKGSMYKVFHDAFKAIGRDCTKEEATEGMHHTLSYTLKSHGVPESEWPSFFKAIDVSLDEEETIEKNPPFPETVEVFKELAKRGCRIGFVSGNSAFHIRKVIAHWKFPALYEIIMGSDIYTKGKPDPEPILWALERMGIEATHDVVYVGDSMQDAEAGKAAGTDVVIIDRDHRYSDYQGTFIRDLRELLD